MTEPTTNPSLWQRMWPVAVAIGLVFCALAGRATWEHMTAYKRAVAAEKAGAIKEAIREYRQAVRWYTPWGPWHDDAAEALLDIGTRVQREDPALAVLALDAMRSGLISARSLYQPRADLVAEANTRIPPLLVRWADRSGDKRDKKALLAQFRADYSRRIGVPLWASFAVSLGFLAWAGGLVMAFARGVDADGRLRRQVWPWLGGSLAGFAVWTLAMWLA